MNNETLPDLSLSDESKYVIRSILQSKTAETDGVLNIDELAECLEAFGMNADDEDIEFLKKHFDDNGDGELEVHEVMSNIDVLNWHCFYGKELMREFKKIDKDGDGIIRYPEMLRVLTTYGDDPLPIPEGRQLLDVLARKFDANFDGKFSYAEFVKIYMSDLLPYKKLLGQNEPSSEEEKQHKAAPRKKKIIKKKRSSIAAGAEGATGGATGGAAVTSSGATGGSHTQSKRKTSNAVGVTSSTRPPPTRRPSASVQKTQSSSKTPVQRRTTTH